MAGLFAAERRAGLEHFFQHIFVADVGAQHADAGFFQRDFEAHVRHGGGDDGVGFQLSLRVQIAGGGEQHAVAVDDAAGGVAEQGAVGVAVEGYTRDRTCLRIRATILPRVSGCNAPQPSLIFFPSGETWMKVA